jgi:hypothetical protein
VLRELVKRADSPPEAEPVTAPVPIPEPATVLPPLTPETAVNGLAPPTLTSMANHTATVSIPEGEYIGGPGVKKTRKRKTDTTVLELYEDIRRFTRTYSLDELEGQIASLERARDFMSGKIRRMTYDVPTIIRQQPDMIEPTSVLRTIGPMPTESEVIGRKESFETPRLLRFTSILDRYKKGSENHKRLGCYAKYRISGIDYEDVNDLKEMVNEAMDEKLIEAHTRLITGIADADKALEEAMKDENLTLKDQDRAGSAWANHCRSLIRDAHEELNIALASANQFDLTMETVDLLKGLRATVASQRKSFNALAAQRRLKGVDL